MLPVCSAGDLPGCDVGRVLTTTAAPHRPQSLLKKRKRDEAWAEAKAADTAAKKKATRAKRSTIFKRAEQYVKEYRTAEADLVRLKRAAKLQGGFYVEPEPKLLFVVRLRGINQIHPRTKKILQLLRLRQINNGVFVRANKATMNMLRRVEPYVMYGYPNLKTASAPPEAPRASKRCQCVLLCCFWRLPATSVHRLVLLASWRLWCRQAVEATVG